MAHRLLIRGARQWAVLPHVAQIAIIYLSARIVTTLFLAVAAARSDSLSRFGADASISDFVLGWDAQWYWSVAVYGYPSELPLTESGEVAENAWAFMPLFAYAARILGVLLGSWGAGAFVIAFAAGFVACLALYRLLHDRIGNSAALWAVVFFASGPLAAMFQVGYAESLFLCFLLLAIDLVSRRRYGWVYLLIPLAAFTRPGILAFGLFIALHGIARLFTLRTERIPRAHVVHILALGALATICGFAWQVVAAIVTGDPEGYLATELSWRRNWIQDPSPVFIPFDGWVQAAQFWFGQWGLPGWAGIVALVLLVAGAAYALLRAKSVRALGIDIRLWSASYLLYLLAVFFPQSSIFRLLLPLTPLWGAIAVPRNRGYRLAVLALCLVGQYIWIIHMYGLGNSFWQVP